GEGAPLFCFFFWACKERKKAKKEHPGSTSHGGGVLSPPFSFAFSMEEKGYTENAKRGHKEHRENAN
ncbi:MAG: hypothetical protein ACKOAY_11045, partial [Haliscomenobacter sp.]